MWLLALHSHFTVHLGDFLLHLAVDNAALSTFIPGLASGVTLSHFATETQNFHLEKGLYFETHFCLESLDYTGLEKLLFAGGGRFTLKLAFAVTQSSNRMLIIV
jgi:hypothetical protein